MAIAVWGYLDELAVERGEIDAAIDAVLKSGRLILGKHVEEFERRFAAYCGAGHGVGVNSGTDALFLALKAMAVGPGDEVVTVANTAVPTVAAIVATGATPRFVDIDPATYLMDVEQVTAALSERTKCVVPVHLYGQCVDMTRLAQLAESRGLKMLEDCAQAHGAEHQGRKAGSMSDAGAFSFYPTKILGGYGDGGLVTGLFIEIPTNPTEGRVGLCRTGISLSVQTSLTAAGQIISFDRSVDRYLLLRKIIWFSPGTSSSCLRLRSRRWRPPAPGPLRSRLRR